MSFQHESAAASASASPGPYAMQTFAEAWMAAATAAAAASAAVAHPSSSPPSSSSSVEEQNGPKSVNKLSREDKSEKNGRQAGEGEIGEEEKEHGDRRHKGGNSNNNNNEDGDEDNRRMKDHPADQLRESPAISPRGDGKKVNQ